MNPMSEFKQGFSKTYEIQGKSFLFRSLNTKESSDIEKEIARQSISLSSDNEFSIRKIETLATCLVSVDGINLNKFEDVQIEVSKGTSERDAIKHILLDLDDSFTSLLYLFYLDMLKEKDKKYEKEAKFLNGSK